MRAGETRATACCRRGPPGAAARGMPAASNLEAAAHQWHIDLDHQQQSASQQHSLRHVHPSHLAAATVGAAGGRQR